MRNSRGHTILIELMIVLLFFSLAQMAVVQVFAAAHQKALSSRATHSALALAQDIAERLQTAQNPEDMLAQAGFVPDAQRYRLLSEDGYELEVALRTLDDYAAPMHEAVLTARAGEKVLFTFPSVIYEGANHP